MCPDAFFNSNDGPRGRDVIMITFFLWFITFHLLKQTSRHFQCDRMWRDGGGGAGGGGQQPRSDCCDSDVLGPNVSVSMQRFIEKNKSIQETPQHPCVSADVTNNKKKSNIDPKSCFFWMGIFLKILKYNILFVLHLKKNCVCYWSVMITVINIIGIH